MTHAPINPRADVSPTCRGSTGTRHNGWNPAPLVDPSRVSFLSFAPQGDSTGLNYHGWNPDWSALPINHRTCGVAHALHRIIISGPCSLRSRRGLCHRSARGGRRAPYAFIASPHGERRRLRRGLRWGGFGGVGLLAPATAACSGATGTGALAGFGARSGTYVRSCLEGGIASLGRSLAHASGGGLGGDACLLLLDRRGGGLPASTGGGHRPCRFAQHDRPAHGGIAAGRRPNGLRPVRSCLHSSFGHARHRASGHIAHVPAHAHIGGIAS